MLPFLDLKTVAFTVFSFLINLIPLALGFSYRSHLLTSCHFLSSLQAFHCFLEAQCTKLEGCTFQVVHSAVGTSCVLQIQLLFNFIGQLVLVSQHHDVAHLYLPMIYCNLNFPCKAAMQSETHCSLFSS